MLIFLSQRYFTSINCLREARAWAAAKETKGLVLVYETAPKRGAAPLEQFEAECPDDLRPVIFSPPNLASLIPFYRLERVWLETAK